LLKDEGREITAMVIKELDWLSEDRPVDVWLAMLGPPDRSWWAWAERGVEGS
jgi:hypothetical protein